MFSYALILVPSQTAPIHSTNEIRQIITRVANDSATPVTGNANGMTAHATAQEPIISQKRFPRAASGNGATSPLSFAFLLARNPK